MKKRLSQTTGLLHVGLACICFLGFPIFWRGCSELVCCQLRVQKTVYCHYVHIHHNILIHNERFHFESRWCCYKCFYPHLQGWDVSNLPCMHESHIFHLPQPIWLPRSKGSVTTIPIDCYSDHSHYNCHYTHKRRKCFHWLWLVCCHSLDGKKAGWGWSCENIIEFVNSGQVSMSSLWKETQ